ncbi:MAG: tetratricopeptide repeat protein [Planctomycetota bacterium]|nr:tetratricopeptide repeat protein [Planctomycetota bacterium]
MHSNTRRLLILLSSMLACLGVGLGTWWKIRPTPLRQYRAAVAAFGRDELALVDAAAESLREEPDYQPHAHLLRGMLWLRTGRLYEAIEQFGYANQHPDTKPLAYALSGEALYKARLLRDALPILSVALQENPRNVDARRWLAAAYYDIGAIDLALVQLQEVAELAPDDPRPHRLRGLIYHDFERYEPAIAEYRQSLERGPPAADLDEIRWELAHCQSKQRQYAEAWETLQGCCPIPNVLSLQAECQYALGNRLAAEALADRALQADPQHMDALRLRAGIALTAGKASEALPLLERAVNSHPKEYPVRLQLAQTYQLLGRTQQAAAETRIVQELQQLRKKFTELHEQAFRDVANAELRYQLGLVAGQLDKPLLAISWFEAALALDPQHQAAQKAWEVSTGKTPDSQPSSKPDKDVPTGSGERR